MTVVIEERISNKDSRQPQQDGNLWIQDKYILEALEKSKSHSKRMATPGTATIGSDHQFIQNRCSNLSNDCPNHSTNSPLTKEIDGAVDRLPPQPRRSDVDWWRNKIRRESNCTGNATEAATEPTTDTDTITSESWGNHRLHEDTISVQTSLSEVTAGSHETLTSKKRTVVESRLTVLIPDVIRLKKTNRRGGFRFFKRRSFWSRTKAVK